MAGESSGNSTSVDSVAAAIDVFVAIFGMLIIIFGTVGNFLTLITMTFYHTLRVSTRLMFFCLALNDLGAIYSGVLRYWQLAVFKYDLRHENVIACRFHTFVVYMAYTMSNWILCLIATERFCLTVVPLKKVYFKNIKVIVSLLVTMTILAVLKNCPVLARYHENGKCSKKLPIDINLFVWLDIIVGNIIPNVYLIMTTAAIVIKIYFQQRKVNPSGENISNNIISQPEPQGRNKVFSATFMLMAVTIYQSIVVIPGIAFNSLLDTGQLVHVDPVMVKAVHRILLLFLFSNNAVNFYLYMLTARGFRRAFLSLCFRVMRQKSREHS